MRLILLTALALATAACGEQKPAESKAEVVAVDANTLAPDALSAKLVGAYQSTLDARAGLVITPDGRWTETYQGTQPIVSAWRVFPGDQPPAGATETFTPASRYLEVKGEDGDRFYELGMIGADGFDMFYTARGNHLSFTRTN